ncbi:MAG: epoxyqueuosine reductase [Methanocorpusculum parvum]|nr:epoxyqueuosine reductase [Methanocorpusculum parvum]
MSFKETALKIIREKTADADWIREPLVGFADVSSKHIRSLRSSVADDHVMPEEVLPEATSILSYFLPFTKAAGACNKDGDFPSQQWADLYNQTNALIAEINEALVSALEADGVKAAIPAGGFDTGRLLSRWSQRHIAEAAGLGTFGVNNMLITRAGSMGRFGSVVTALEEKADVPLTEELCIAKAGGKCLVCVKRCPTKALSENGFDRHRCYAVCLQAEKTLGADVCGKCAVAIPCAIKE